jgi:DNA helicase-2/ATP-dependent DNA helicase PcrA
VGIEPDFELLDEDDRQAFAQQTLGSDSGLGAWSNARISQRTPSERIAGIGDVYELAKRAANVVDFDDLVVYTTRLFIENESLAGAYGTRFPHILVDEFQDTNLAQFAIIQSLAPFVQTIDVFADDDQAIFGWAGAETANIRRFVEELEAREVPLTVNYRSRQEIVSRANHLIAAEPTASGRQMSADQAGGEVVVNAFRDVAEEAEAIASEIERSVAGHLVLPSEICVLSRTEARATRILPALQGRGLPAQRWMGSTASAERKVIATCLSVVRARLNDRQALRVCNLLGMDETEERDTRTLLTQADSEPAAAALLEVNSLAASGAGPVGVMKQVRRALEFARPELVSFADSLLQTVLAFERHDPDFTLEHLLADLSLGATGGAPTEGGGIKVATIHRTKGLQWPWVYLIGLEEGLLPDWRAKTRDQLSEERKLCFVGVCRAETRLVLSRVRNHRGYTQNPSRFISEMGL